MINIFNFKIRIFKSQFPRGKRLENLLTENASQPHRNFVFFSKKLYSNNIDFSSKNMKNSLSPKMTAKGFQEPLIKSYFINRKFKSYLFPLRKRLEKIIDGKGVSAPKKHSDFSKRNVFKNSEFNCKNMRNTYSLFSSRITSNMSLFQKDALKLHTPFRLHFLLS